ncbi:MAG: histidine phosphatase family protein [Armatimonadetes bacterium]|nr:histidine phosphatase family protein [Armatimonadota bacterium]
MGSILLVRHGETDLNRGEPRWVGWLDPPLNETGRQQAAAVGNRLSREPIEAVYSSDLRRAAETAQALAAPHNMTVFERSAFREVNYGDWEGLTEGDCRQFNPQSLQERMDDPENVPPPGGESYRQLMDRFHPALESIAVQHSNGSVVLVSHHGNIRLLLCRLMGIPLKQYRCFQHSNGAITEIGIRKDRLIIRTFNDTCHLTFGSNLKR